MNQILLGAPINDDVSDVVVARPLSLEADEESDKDVYLYINSPGGVGGNDNVPTRSATSGRR